MAQSLTDYRPEVDGLRAIAVTSVILYHLGLGAFSGGFVGVDIFFVISGYLISAIIMREMGEGRFSFAGFYERRIRRIIPALYLVLFVSSIAAWLLLTPGQLKDYGQSLVATVSFLSNIYFRMKSGYFSPAAEEIPLLHMWSLSVEEQFYIGFPVLLLAIYRFAPKWLNAALWTALIGSLAYCLYREMDDQTANFFLPHTRAWELAAGAIIATLRPRLQAGIEAKAAGWRLAELFGLALMIVPIFYYDNATSFPGWAAIPPVLGTALIILASTASSWGGRILASGPFVGIGLISYSAYLWHQPLFAFVRVSMVGAPPDWLLWALVAATFILAWVSWRFVERPFRSRSRFTRKQIFVLAAVASVPLLAFGLAMHVMKGVPARYDAPTLALAQTALPSPERDNCHTDGIEYRKPDKACRYFGDRVTWAAMGDSHVIEPAYALAEVLRPSGQGVVHLSFSGCQPALTFDTSNPGCAAWTRETVGWLEGQKDIRNVVLAYRHSFYLYGDQVHAWPEQPRNPPNFTSTVPPDRARTQYWQGYAALVQRLGAAGKTVYIIGPIPDLPANAERYIYHRRAGQPTGVSRVYYEARNRDALRELAAVAKLPFVRILHPEQAFCDAKACASIIDGKGMYFDDNHLSMSGARRLIATEVAGGRLPVR